MPAAQPVPVTVVGGYLGAGKTTLVNQVLLGGHGRRIAVLVNDFGEVNIDAALVASVSGSTIELTNGCACCAMGDNLAEAFHGLLSAQPPFEHVLVEASGVADPARLAAWATIPGLRVDSIVVLADAERVMERAADAYAGTTVLRQLAAADVVALTKTDLCTAASVERVRQWLARAVPGRPVVDVTGIGPRRAAALLAGPARHDGDERLGEPAGGHHTDRQHDDHHHHDGHDHDHDDQHDGATDHHAEVHRTRFVDLPEPIEPAALHALLDGIDGLVRAKGVVDLVGRGRCLVQLVGPRRTVETTEVEVVRLGLVTITCGPE